MEGKIRKSMPNGTAATAGTFGISGTESLRMLAWAACRFLLGAGAFALLVGRTPRAIGDEQTAVVIRSAKSTDDIRQDFLKPISKVSADIGKRPVDYPTDFTTSRFPSSAGTTGVQFRDWEYQVHSWQPTEFWHRPLYFSDENLERHGRSFGWAQPAVSAMHFTARVAAWPYAAVAYPPSRCVYNLGCEPPGSCASYLLYRPFLDLGGRFSHRCKFSRRCPYFDD